LLAGGATQRVEHIFGEPTEADFNRIIDVTCQEAEATHLGAGTPEQKAGIAEGAAPASTPGIPDGHGDQGAKPTLLEAHQEPIAIALDEAQKATEPATQKGISPTLEKPHEKPNEKAICE
jgi:hypothetical protein